MEKKVYNAIKMKITKPGHTILGKDIAEELGISEEKFWEYAKQLKRKGKIKITTNCVYLP